MPRADYEKVYTYRQTDWSGGQSDASPTLLKDNESQTLKNVSLDLRGTLYPCSGHHKRYGTELDAKVQALGFYLKSNIRIYLLVAKGTVLYYDDLLATEPALTSLKTGLYESATWNFLPYGDYLYMSNGKNIPMKWNGIDAPSNLSTSYLFSSMAVHANCLWGVETGTDRLRWSIDGDTWNTLDFLDYLSSDGNAINSIIHYNSQLVLFKTTTKAYLAGTTPDNFELVESVGIGAVGHMATALVTMANGYEYIVYAALDGIYVTDLTEDINLLTSRMADTWRQRVTKAVLSKIAVTSWRNYILISLPVDEATINNEVWIYDLRYKSWSILSGLNIPCWAIVNLPKQLS